MDSPNPLPLKFKPSDFVPFRGYTRCMRRYQEAMEQAHKMNLENFENLLKNPSNYRRYSRTEIPDVPLGFYFYHSIYHGLVFGGIPSAIGMAFEHRQKIISTLEQITTTLF